MKDMHVFLSDTSTHWYEYSDSDVSNRCIIQKFSIDCDLLLLKVPTDELPAVCQFLFSELMDVDKN